jgi:hypothetical protein
MEGVMIANETTAKDSVVNERGLTVEELDAATGGVLPQGFMKAVWTGVIVGFIEAGGGVDLKPNG